jgi:hypothetical protein
VKSNKLSYIFVFGILQLGKNKEVQTKLRNEILDAFGSNDQLTFEKLKELKYLDQVFNGRYCM